MTQICLPETYFSTYESRIFPYKSDDVITRLVMNKHRVETYLEVNIIQLDTVM